MRVVDALAAALADGTPASDLVVLRTVRRHRSALWFVGLRRDRCPRWVVKRPDPDRRQQDLRSPSGADAQLRGLLLLHEHLSASSDRISAPRPVGLLPELEALAMEHVGGQTLTGLLRPAVLLRPGPLLVGLAGAAEALLLIHQIASSSAVERIDSRRMRRRVGGEVRRHLEAAGLPCGDRWGLTETTSAPWVESREVLLHGDWAPENVVVSGSGISCLDPELSHYGLPERDVSRFLVMFSEAPLFVLAPTVGGARQFRRRAASTFLTGYYGDRGVSPLLQPLLVEALAARWAMRDQDVARRSPPGTRSRRLLLRRHFTALIEEAASPGWPEAVRPAASAGGAH